MSTLSEKLLESMELISNAAIDRTSKDLTVECLIESIVDSKNGIYNVKYLSNTLSVTASNPSLKYNIDDKVYVLIPEGNMNNPKFIIGLVSSQNGESHVDKDYQTDYIQITDNLFTSLSEGIELCSYKTETIDLNNPLDPNIFPSNFTYIISNYLNNYNAFALSMFIKTSLPLEQQKAMGDYGLQFMLPFIRNEEDGTQTSLDIYYSINTDNIFGNPYNLSEGVKQTIYFDVDENLIYDINRKPRIVCYIKDFIQSEEEKPYDVVLSNFSLNIVQKIPEENKTGYYLYLTASEGPFFLNSSSKKTKTITPHLLLNNEEVTFEGADCYWFEEDVNVTPSSSDYTKMGGVGWKCLNKTDGSNYVTNVYTQDVKIEDVIASKRYKCLLQYDNTNIKSEITFKNFNVSAGVDLIIENNAKTVAKGGLVNLICTINYEDTDNILLYDYRWARYSATGSYIDSDFYTLVKQEPLYKDNLRIGDRVTITFDTNKVEDDLNTIYCSGFIINNGKTELIETKSVDIVLEDKSNKLIIENDKIVYNYDADGDSPLRGEEFYDRPITSQVKAITPLSFKIYKDTGAEFTDLEYRQCEVEWWVPKASMFKLPDTVLKDSEISEDYYIVKGTGRLELNYKISDKFNYTVLHSNILLKVKAGDLKLSESADIRFTKDGMSGTNGTKFTASLFYNGYAYGEKNPEGLPQKLHFVYTNANKQWYLHELKTNSLVKAFGLDRNTYFNSKSKNSNIQLVLYKDGVEYTKTDYYTVNWSIIDASEIYTCFDIAKDNDGIYYLKSKLDKDNPWEYYPDDKDKLIRYSNIIQAEVIVNEKLDNQEYKTTIYVRYPIEVTYLNDAISEEKLMNMIVPVINGGYSEVIYAADGTNPKYNQIEHFYCEDNYVTPELTKSAGEYIYKWDYSKNFIKDKPLWREQVDENGKPVLDKDGKPTYVQENLPYNQCSISPVEKYDDSIRNNYISVRLELASDRQESLAQEQIQLSTDIKVLKSYIDYLTYIGESETKTLPSLKTTIVKESDSINKIKKEFIDVIDNKKAQQDGIDKTTNYHNDIGEFFIKISDSSASAQKFKNANNDYQTKIKAVQSSLNDLYVSKEEEIEKKLGTFLTNYSKLNIAESETALSELLSYYQVEYAKKIADTKEKISYCNVAIVGDSISEFNGDTFHSNGVANYGIDGRGDITSNTQMWYSVMSSYTNIGGQYYNNHDYKITCIDALGGSMVYDTGATGEAHSIYHGGGSACMASNIAIKSGELNVDYYGHSRLDSLGVKTGGNDSLDLIIIEAGTNDAINQVSLENMSKAYHDMLVRIHDKYTKALIVSILPSDSLIQISGENNVNNVKQGIKNAINNFNKEIGKNIVVLTIDPSACFSESYDGGIHLNNVGQFYLGELVARELKTVSGLNIRTSTGSKVEDKDKYNKLTAELSYINATLQYINTSMINAKETYDAAITAFNKQNVKSADGKIVSNKYISKYIEMKNHLSTLHVDIASAVNEIESRFKELESSEDFFKEINITTYGIVNPLKANDDNFQKVVNNEFPKLKDKNAAISFTTMVNNQINSCLTIVTNGITSVENLKKEIAKKSKSSVDTLASVTAILNAGTNTILHIKPINCLFNQYGMSNINGWDGSKLEIDENGQYILAPQMGAGEKNDDNTFTGLVMGKSVNGEETHNGLFGYYHGQQSIFLNAETGGATFGVAGAGQIIIEPNSEGEVDENGNLKYRATLRSGNFIPKDETHEGSGMEIDLATPSIRFGSGNFYVTEDGAMNASGKGTIAGWSIEEDRLTSIKDKNKITIQAGTNYDSMGNAIEACIYSNSHDKLEETSKGFYLGGNGISIGKSLKAECEYDEQNNLTSVMYIGDVTSFDSRWEINGYSTVTEEGDTKVSPYGYIRYGNITLNTGSNGVYLGTNGIRLGDKFRIKPNGVVEAGDLNGSRWIISSNQEGAYISYSYSEEQAADSFNGGGKIEGFTFDSYNANVFLGTKGISLGINKFFVTNNGEMYAVSGKIGGWSLSDYEISSFGIHLKGNSGEIYCLKDSNKTSDLKDEDYWWKIDGTGQALFNNIKADGGHIGDWVISQGTLQSANGKLTLDADGGMRGDNWELAGWGGNIAGWQIMNGYLSCVDEEGHGISLSSSNSTIMGDNWMIDNNSGYLGQFTFDSEGNLSGQNWAIAATGDGNFGSFYFGADGSIGGTAWSIDASGVATFDKVYAMNIGNYTIDEKGIHGGNFQLQGWIAEPNAFKSSSNKNIYINTNGSFKLGGDVNYIQFDDSQAVLRTESSIAMNVSNKSSFSLANNGNSQFYGSESITLSSKKITLSGGTSGIALSTTGTLTFTSEGKSFTAGQLYTKIFETGGSSLATRDWVLAQIAAAVKK